jgi:quinolinate synthase
MANSITVEDVEQYKQSHPNALIVSYVNTPAEIKAVTDICVTSSNAGKIIAKLPKDVPIFFIPDENLGKHITSQLNRPMDLFPSRCPIHAAVTSADIVLQKREYPDAEVLVHPECAPEVIALADFVGSTAGMVDYAAKSDKNQFIIATECGIMHKINQVSPGKDLILAQEELICPNMKSITMDKILYSLEHMETVISVPEAVRVRAAVALEKMIAYAS